MEQSPNLSISTNEDCFYYCSERNNVVVLFGTLKVQSFILTEVSDCGLLIIVTSSTFLKKKRRVKRKKQLVQDLIPSLSIYIHMCTLYTYTNICMPRFSPSGLFGPSRCFIPTPGLTSKYPVCAVCVCVCIYTHTHPHTLPPALKIEKTQSTPLSFLLSKITPRAKQQVLSSTSWTPPSSFPNAKWNRLHIHAI